MKTTFGVGDILKKGFDLTKKHLGFLAGSTFIYLVIYMLLTRVSRGGAGFLLGIAGFAVSIIFSIGLYKTALLIYSGGEPSRDDFMPDWSTFWSFLITSILMGIIVVIGLILLVIPGIILAIRLSLGYFVVIDKKLSGWAAIQESWNMTRGYSWSILGFFVCSIILVIIASIPFGLGLLVAIPYLALCQAVIYKTIAGNEGEVVVDPVKSPEPTAQAEENPVLETPAPSAEAPVETSPVIE